MECTETRVAWTDVSDAEALVDLLGTPSPRARDKGRPAPLDADPGWLAGRSVEELDDDGAGPGDGLYA